MAASDHHFAFHSGPAAQVRVSPASWSARKLAHWRACAEVHAKAYCRGIGCLTAPRMLLTCRMLAIPPVVRGYHDACLVAGRGIACSGRAGPRRPPLSPASKGTAVAAAAAFAPVFAGFVIHVSLVLTNPGRQSFDLATVLQASKLFLRNMESTSLCSESSVFSVQVPPPPSRGQPWLNIDGS